MWSTIDILCATLTGISSILSIVGASLILLVYHKLPEIRNFTRTLLFYLTIADLMTAAGNLVATVNYTVVGSSSSFSGNCSLHGNSGNGNPSITCIAQSFVTTFSNMASFIWTFVIAVHIWSSIVIRSTRTESYGLHIAYLVGCWILPFGFTFIALLANVLGEDQCYGTGVWCGIRSDIKPEQIELWMYTVDVGWQLSSYVISLVLYMYSEFYIRYYHRNIEMSVITTNLRNEDKYFLFSLLIIYCLKIWGMLRFFITTYTPKDRLAHDYSLQQMLQVLLVLDSFGVSGQGFFNCILFCYHDKHVWNNLRRMYCLDRRDERVLITPRDDRLSADVSPTSTCINVPYGSF